MAQAVNTKSGDRPAWYWDVNDSVGPGRANRRPDVFLVQVLLNQTIRNRDLRDERKQFNSAPDNPLMNQVHGYPPLDFLKVDGVCGTETLYTIAQYQKKVCFSHDGVVDPAYLKLRAAPQLATSSALGNRMIYRLNMDYFDNRHRPFPEEKLPPETRADANRRGTMQA